MRHNRFLILFVGLLCWGGSVFVFFRRVFTSGFDWMPGGPGDGLLILSLHEHWFRFLSGKEGWRELSFFHPAENVLGYSDTFLGTGIVFSIFRFGGLDQFMSLFSVLLILAAIGFWGMYYWMHRFRQFSVPISMFCAVLFVVASPVFLASRNSHLQLLSVWQFPVGFILIELLFRQFREAAPRVAITAALLAGWFCVLAYSTFYMAFFFGLLVLLGLVGALFAFPLSEVRNSLGLIMKHVRELVPALVICIVMGGLFLWTYLPVRQEMGGRPFENVVKQLPLPWDVFNHSVTNLLWGQASALIWPYPSRMRHELELGLTPLLFVFVAVMVFYHLIRSRKRNPLLFVAAFTVLAGTLLIVRAGPLSLWYIPHTLIPGSEGIRAAFRFNLALLTPSIFLFASLLRELSTYPGLFSRIALLILSAFVMLEQIQLADNARIHRSQLKELSQMTPPPPADADVFHAFSRSWPGWSRSIGQNTAVFLAHEWNIKTTNGASGFFPKNWHLYDLEPGKAFKPLVQWMQSQQLKDTVYLLNIDSSEWIRGLDFRISGNSVLDGVDLMRMHPEAFASLSSGGWSQQEAWGVWSEAGEAAFRFAPHHFPDGASRLILSAHGFVAREHPRIDVGIYLNEVLLKRITFSRHNREINETIPIPAAIAYPEKLTFRIEAPASPEELGISNDARNLGIGLRSLTIVSEN